MTTGTDRGKLPHDIDNDSHYLDCVMQKKSEKLKQYIHAKKLRWTSQREVIAQTLLRAKQHLTTEQLFRSVQKKDSAIGYATVARTLRLLVEAGLCEQIDISDGTMRYEVVIDDEHHDHLICTQCGRFIEVFSPKLEKIQADLIRKHGFKEKSHKLQIFGICADCQNVPQS